MIYKVTCEEGSYSSGKSYIYYRIFSKVFKFWPFWTLVTDAYGKASLKQRITGIKDTPLYEGTINQIFEEVKNF